MHAQSAAAVEETAAAGVVAAPRQRSTQRSPQPATTTKDRRRDRGLPRRSPGRPPESSPLNCRRRRLGRGSVKILERIRSSTGLRRAKRRYVQSDVKGNPPPAPPPHPPPLIDLRRRWCAAALQGAHPSHACSSPPSYGGPSCAKALPPSPGMLRCRRHGFLKKRVAASPSPPL